MNYKSKSSFIYWGSVACIGTPEWKKVLRAMKSDKTFKVREVLRRIGR